jgi:MFS family permease
MDNSAVGLNLTGRPLYVLTAMLLLAFAAVIAMPFNITGIVQSFAVSNSTAGLVASTELLAISISSLYVAQIAGRMPARLIYVIGIFAILTANALTIMASSVEPLVLLRAIAGIGGGGVTAMVMFTAGQSRNPEKTFGIINSFVGIMGTLMALILPQALLLYQVTDPQWHLRAADGLYGVYLVAAIVALLLIRWVPIPLASIATPGETAANALPSPAGWRCSGWGWCSSGTVRSASTSSNSACRPGFPRRRSVTLSRWRACSGSPGR